MGNEPASPAATARSAPQAAAAIITLDAWDELQRHSERRGQNFSRVLCFLCGQF